MEAALPGGLRGTGGPRAQGEQGLRGEAAGSTSARLEMPLRVEFLLRPGLASGEDPVPVFHVSGGTRTLRPLRERSRDRSGAGVGVGRAWERECPLANAERLRWHGKKPSCFP